jgi:signal transduction histidine kinase
MNGSLNDRFRSLAFRPHLPRRTVRLRLTLLYGGLFLLSGAALLAITYLLVVNATSGCISNNQLGVSAFICTPGQAATGAGTHSGVAFGFATGGTRKPTWHGQIASTTGGLPRGTPNPQQLAAQATRQHNSTLHQLLIQSGIALALMSLASILLGWLVAGRVLRPLRTITSTTREISASSLHRRLALGGPDDELKELGDTIDELLARLAASFQSQRRFVADASHELRTPLALSRAMLQVALADPDLTLDSLRATCEDVLQAGQEHEQLIEALLMLARSQRGLYHRETVKLGTLVEKILADHQQRADAQGLTINARLDATAAISGDPRLVSRLVSNLIENAIRYNCPDGHIDVTVSRSEGRAELAVANSGPTIPSRDVERLLQPFQRLASTRGSDAEGHGLGLSIVAAIASAHDATLIVEPRPGGGLRVGVAFPAESRRERPLGHGRGDQQEGGGRESSGQGDAGEDPARLERAVEPALHPS